MRNPMVVLGAFAMVLAVGACGEATSEVPETGPQTPAKQTERSHTDKESDKVATGDVYLLKVDGMT